MAASAPPFSLAPTPLRHSKLPIGVPSGTAEAGDSLGRAGRRQRWETRAPTKWLTAARGGGGSLRLRRTPFGCFTGSLYPNSATRPTRQSRAGGATPMRRPQSLASLHCVCAGAAPFGCFVGSLYPNSVLHYSLRPSGSRARRRPLAEGATRPTRDRLRRRQALVEAANKRRNASDSKSRRPATLPLRRAEISHRSIGRSAGCDPKKSQRPSPARIEKNRSFPARRENPVQKQSMLLNDFPPYPRRAVPLGTRNGQPLPLQVSTPKRELPSGRAGPACPRRAMGSLYPE